MLIKFGNKVFNVITVLIFAGCAGAVLMLTLPFQFFHPDVALLAELFTETRIEREAAIIEIVIQFSPWFVTVVLLGMGVYLALERIVR